MSAADDPEIVPRVLQASPTDLYQYNALKQQQQQQQQLPPPQQQHQQQPLHEGLAGNTHIEMTTQHHPTDQSFMVASPDEQKYGHDDVNNDMHHWQMNNDPLTKNNSSSSELPINSDDYEIRSEYSLEGKERGIHRAARSMKVGAGKGVPVSIASKPSHINAGAVLDKVIRKHARDQQHLDLGDDRLIHASVRTAKVKTSVQSQKLLLDSPEGRGPLHADMAAVHDAVHRKHAGKAVNANLEGENEMRENALSTQDELARLQAHQAGMHDQQLAAQLAIQQNSMLRLQQGGWLARCLTMGCGAPVWNSMRNTSVCSSFVEAVERLLDSGGKVLAFQEMSAGVVVPRVVDDLVIKQTLQQYPHNADLELVIRRTDLLRPRKELIHPRVRVHVCDAISGQWLGQVNQAGIHVGNLVPQQTPAFELLCHGTFLAEWNRHLVWPVSLAQCFQPHVILFFEIYDCLNAEDEPPVHYFEGAGPPSATPSPYEHKVAWAFLKLLSHKGCPNHGPVRLQLYQYSQNRPNIARPGGPSVYFDWVYQKNVGRELYHSTLYVHVGGVVPVGLGGKISGGEGGEGGEGEDGRDSQGFMALSRRMALIQAAQDAKAEAKVGKLLTPMQQRAFARRRGAHGHCIVPNTELYEITAAARGSSSVAFSPDGLILAVACGEHVTFAIKLYEANTGTHIYTYAGHKDIVYDLSWSSDGKELVSSSSDCSAKVWNTDIADLHRAIRPSALFTMQHTSYVYAAKPHPACELIFTGAYDGIIRVWEESTRQCKVGLTHHGAHVNALIFHPSGTHFYSGDGVGVIRIWLDSAITHTHKKEAIQMGERTTVTSMAWKDRFKCLRTFTDPSFKSVPINSLAYSPHPERLVIYFRNNQIVVLDLLSFIVHKSIPIACSSYDLKLALSPDGRYVVAGAEDGKAYFFDLYTGAQVGCINLGFQLPLSDVSWHPTQHVVAFVSFGGNAAVDYPVTAWEFDAELHKAQLKASATKGQQQQQQHLLDAVTVAPEERPAFMAV